MIDENRPSIAELQRLCRDERTNHDADLALVVPVLLEIAAAALAFAEDGPDRWNPDGEPADRLDSALAKVRP